jgi:hypothetical protein
MDQLSIKYNNICHCKTLQNLAKFGFWFENKPSGNPDFQAKNPKSGKGKCWYLYFMLISNIVRTVIWYILWPFSNFAVFWYMFPRFGILCQEKSGNPVHDYKEMGLINAHGPYQVMHKV